MFRRVLIANRGEIARRIISTLHKLKINAVAVYDEREKNAPYVQMANRSVSLGEGSLNDTFLNIEKLLAIARKHSCEAIHPGYGFLAENAEFARLCHSNGIVFIGPKPETIADMGNKVKATELAQRAGIPVIPQIRGSAEEIMQHVTREGFPYLVKAAAGGGGKGMRKANNKKELEEFLVKTSGEAVNYFGNGEVYVEQYIENPRHIEVQILADNQGNTIHLFERECSVQRRFQKIIEEAPAVDIPQSIKENLYKDAISLAKEVGYTGAGTVEFLVDKTGNYYFLEMNTRIQVEHGITELITGVDIVEEQINIAAGNSFSKAIGKSLIRGHAIEARLYAEDPSNDFKPSPGKIRLFQTAEVKNVRIDTDARTDEVVLADFDPMLAKIMVYGKNRSEGINLLKKIINGTIVHGVKHNLSSISNILDESDFLSNRVTTHYIEEHPEVLRSANEFSPEERNILMTAGIYISLQRYPSVSKHSQKLTCPGYWRLLNDIHLSLGNTSYIVRLKSLSHSEFKYSIDNEIIEAVISDEKQHYIDMELSGTRKRVYFSWDEVKMAISLSIDYREIIFRRNDFLSKEAFSNKQFDNSSDDTSKIRAPLSGKVIRVNVNRDQIAHHGDILLVIESMKMENEIKLTRQGQIRQIFVNQGQMVNEGDILVQMHGTG